jgi:hypothetical protein
MKINSKEGLLMKIETKQKIKEFYETRKLEIAACGLIIGGIIIATILKPKQAETKFEIIEVLPEWAENWRQKCDDNMLLYESGLPIFADEESMIIYRDALADNYSVQDAEEQGLTVIERA